MIVRLVSNNDIPARHTLARNHVMPQYFSPRFLFLSFCYFCFSCYIFLHIEFWQETGTEKNQVDQTYGEIWMTKKVIKHLLIGTACSRRAIVKQWIENFQHHSIDKMLQNNLEWDRPKYSTKKITWQIPAFDRRCKHCQALKNTMIFRISAKITHLVS